MIEQPHKNWKLYMIILIAVVGISLLVGYLYLNYSDYRIRNNKEKIVNNIPTPIPGSEIPLIRDAIRDIPLLEEQSLAEPANAQLLRQQAQNFIMIDDLDKAASTYEQESHINSDDPTLYKELGNVYAQLQQTDKAIAAYLKSIDINPIDNNSYIDLANLYIIQRPDREKVISTYEDAIKNNPKNMTFHILFGSFYEQIGEETKAINLYQRVLNIDPLNSIAKSKLQELSEYPQESDSMN